MGPLFMTNAEEDDEDDFTSEEDDSLVCKTFSGKSSDSSIMAATLLASSVQNSVTTDGVEIEFKSTDAITMDAKPANSKAYFKEDVASNGPRDVSVFFKINRSELQCDFRPRVSV